MDIKSTICGDKPIKVLVNFCRVLLGLTFLFSGVVKAIDPVGTQIKLNDYLYAFGMGGTLLESTILIMACLLAGFEILIGAYMLLGVFNKGTSLIMLIVLALFTPFTLYVAIKNPVEECGCFGDALVLTNWQTFGKNLFLLLLAVMVYIKRSAIVSWMDTRRHWLVTLFVVVISVRFMIGNINGLPVLDFRPYKVGTDLKQMVLEERHLSMNDFCLMDDSLNDVTGELLQKQGYTFLLVMPHTENASEDNLDLVDGVFDYCEQWGYDMVGLTASGSDAINQWRENNETDLRFLYCDEIPLLTMVRSNPGVVLIKDGVIINKWSHMSIPQEEELCAPLEEISIGAVPSFDPMHTPWAVALLFLLPLMLLVVIDRLKHLVQ